ncbi:Fructose-specific phosphotransferase enzyme IIB component [Sebaldella termitidis]|jgi:D-glucosaminate-specific PTS system IIB component|uniref:PTS system sorbose subfamily IIB component n=1 Tax=Sebaldella termitidis (strain ATCC 33386 / NCTC 11300) TaxID=526218 RepID=D1AG71_SEBTE|nr:PTS sugar transporter subunit IIB [Sebaldella termitidis]ACZ10697.1 PTS system sorbose subfamily IIB component [Sebaldella termitidis ATCC 33386]MBP7979585.1 PTS sugar transporter subunit IIB [Sebaldella sp.]SUI26038.1 Fructose-specific phosphotransferase enzyme IIB component [Sebaldella termitidis]
MAELVLTRIDSRLIHGQVVTKWVGQSGANRIIVVSDELVNDEFMKNIYLMAAPPSVKVDVYGTEEAGKLWKEDQFGTGKVLLLFPSLAVLRQTLDAGLEVGKLQVGGLGGGPSRKVVFQNITLDDKDVEILKELAGKGVDIIFQTIPEDKPQKFEEILKKY